MKVRKGLKRRLQDDATIYIRMRYADGLYELYRTHADTWLHRDTILFRTGVFDIALDLLKQYSYEYVIPRIQALKEERINKRVRKL